MTDEETAPTVEGSVGRTKATPAPIVGGVDSGDQAVGDFAPFYAGPVGVRQKGGVTEAAYFGPKFTVPILPFRGSLDGSPVLVIGVEFRAIGVRDLAKRAVRGTIAVILSLIPAQ